MPDPYIEKTLLSTGITVNVSSQEADTSIVQTAWSLENTGYNVTVTTQTCLLSLSKPSTDVLSLN